jgi:uncharacterized protein YjlB
MADEPQVLTLTFGDAGAFPNHRTLPVLVFRRAAPVDARTPEAIARYFEDTWPQHGWRADWRWGIYDFPHYHSTAHEVLGVYRGQASLRLGDRAGATVAVTAGDMIVLPAGTAHQNLGASSDFHVVGGYPDGQTADLLKGAAGERPAADERIAHVPLPRSDPLRGVAGPLARAWQLPG